MAKRKKSELWEYFIEETGTAVAPCTIILCSTKVRRAERRIVAENNIPRQKSRLSGGYQVKKSSHVSLL